MQAHTSFWVQSSKPLHSSLFHPSLHSIFFFIVPLDPGDTCSKSFLSEVPHWISSYLFHEINSFHYKAESAGSTDIHRQGDGNYKMTYQDLHCKTQPFWKYVQRQCMHVCNADFMYISFSVLIILKHHTTIMADGYYIIHYWQSGNNNNVDKKLPDSAH